jgi:hypothetical protein
MEVELETYKMKTKLLQRQCNTNKVSYNSTSNYIISCENCEILKNQLSSAQDELDSVKLVNKLLQDDLELLRANLEKLNNKCAKNGINDKLRKRLKVSKEERKSDSKVNHPTLEYIPVIINQRSKSDMRNGSKIVQGHKTNINKLLLVNEAFGKENQKEERELHLTNNKKNKIS